jgi:hypothetical protein
MNGLAGGERGRSWLGSLTVVRLTRGVPGQVRGTVGLVSPRVASSDSAVCAHC